MATGCHALHGHLDPQRADQSKGHGELGDLLVIAKYTNRCRRRDVEGGDDWVSWSATVRPSRTGARGRGHDHRDAHDAEARARARPTLVKDGRVWRTKSAGDVSWRARRRLRPDHSGLHRSRAHRQPYRDADAAVEDADQCRVPVSSTRARLTTSTAGRSSAVRTRVTPARRTRLGTYGSAQMIRIFHGRISVAIRLPMRPRPISPRVIPGVAVARAPRYVPCSFWSLQTLPSFKCRSRSRARFSI